MKTRFSALQLADPATRASENIIRKCVHCGFCMATCPTYVLLGDELDSPRGRIYLIKEMLESELAPSPLTVKHVDRCLSCLSCMSTCPSNVNYMHLVDHARAYIEERYRRPVMDRVFRKVLAATLPHPRRFRLALQGARLGRPFLPLLRRFPALKPLVAMLELAPTRIPSTAKPAPSAPTGRRGRIALLQGCAESVLRPQIRESAIGVLHSAGFQVERVRGEGCCGALLQHMGRHDDALSFARRNVDAWSREIEAAGLDAIVTTSAGCGTAIKHYGYMLRGDPAYAGRAASVCALAKDVSEVLEDLPPRLPQTAPGLTVAYHSACSLQHGQKINNAPRRLLRAAGFTVGEVPEGHLCCGSAGVYNILQPEIAARLRARKAAHIDSVGAHVIAAGNIGCITQLAGATRTPIVHTIELLHWAQGGPVPAGLKQLRC